MAFGSHRNKDERPVPPAAPARPGTPAGGIPATPAASSLAARGAAPGADEAARGAAGSRLVRPYTLTGGRTRSEAADFPIETLVVTTEDGRQRTATLAHEQRRIAELCGDPISVAEVAARIGVPLGVARVLVGDLSAEGVVDVHRPSGGDRPDLKLLERVLGGIRAL
jgi:hypothetical protein